jgi:hypothetical protein
MNPMFSEPVYWFGIDAGIVLAAIALGMYVFGVRWLARIRHESTPRGRRDGAIAGRPPPGASGS